MRAKIEKTGKDGEDIQGKVYFHGLMFLNGNDPSKNGKNWSVEGYMW